MISDLVMAQMLTKVNSSKSPEDWKGVDKENIHDSGKNLLVRGKGIEIIQYLVTYIEGWQNNEQKYCRINQV